MVFGTDIEASGNFGLERGMRSGDSPPFAMMSIGCFPVLLLFDMSRMKNGGVWGSWCRRGSFA